MNTKLLFLLVTFGISILTLKAQPDTLTASINPFPSSTNLTIHNLTSDTVTFKIYTLTGQVVQSFFDSIILSGTITVTFNASTLPDGIYFASMTKNSENSTLKLQKNQTATSTSDNPNNSTAIQIFPNPTSDYLTISTDLKIKEFEIHSIDGKLIQISTGQKRIINIQNFDSGIYLLHLKTADKTFIKKVWKK
jgi:hypothetical protein